MEVDFKYKHVYDRYDILAEVISIVLLLTNAVQIWNAMQILPDVVPSHFDMEGKPDGFGGKSFIWWPFIFSIVLYILITVISRFPQLYESRMNKTDKYNQYRLTVKQTITFKPIILTVFPLVTFFMIQTAQLKLTEYLKYLVVLIPVLVFSHIIYWLLRMSKLN